MNFFKKLFKNSKDEKGSNDKKTQVNEEQEYKSEPQSNHKSKVEFSEIATHEYFDKRYEEDTIDESMLETTLKMIEGYFPANKIKPVVENPINHPKNLDQTIDDGFGFLMYCKAMNMEENFAVALLSMAFNDFMIKNHGFKLYKDSEPEYPLRVMTLKYDNQGAKLSLYPIEYTSKVLNYEASFNDLYERIKNNIEDMPTSNEIFDKLMSKFDDNTE